MKKYTIEQSGRSMIEMLGVLAIVGVLSVAGIAGYSKAMAKYKVNKLVDQVSTTAANVRTVFAGQGNYKGLLPNNAWQLGIYPEDAAKQCDNDGKYTAGCARNAMGGGIAVCEYTSDTFTLYLSGLSKEACSALATADWGSAGSTEGVIADGIYDGNAATYADFAVCQAGQGLIPLADLQASKVAEIAKMCPCTSGENNCTLGFIFR